jgi:hypothetical protein
MKPVGGVQISTVGQQEARWTTSGRPDRQAQTRAQADPLDEDRMGGPHTTRTKTRSQEKGHGRHRADDESLCCRRRATDAACAEDKPRTADATRADGRATRGRDSARDDPQRGPARGKMCAW